MLPIIGGLLSGGASLLGSIFSSDTSAQNTQDTIAANYASQQSAQQFNAQQAQKQMDFQAQQVAGAQQYNTGMVQEAQAYDTGQVEQQEAFQRSQQAEQERYETQMSNSAYQRAQADLKAAGINPILAAGANESTPSVSSMSGSSASSPVLSSPSGSGASASISPMKYDFSGRTSPLAQLGDVASKALNSAVSVKTFDKMTQEIANLQAEQAKTAATTATEGERKRLVGAEADIAGYKENVAQLEGSQAGAILKLPVWMQDLLAQTAYTGNKVSDTIAPLVSSAKAVTPFMNRWGNW